MDRLWFVIQYYYTVKAGGRCLDIEVGNENVGIYNLCLYDIGACEGEGRVGLMVRFYWQKSQDNHYIYDLFVQ